MNVRASFTLLNNILKVWLFCFLHYLSFLYDAFLAVFALVSVFYVQDFLREGILFGIQDFISSSQLSLSHPSLLGLLQS
jgi:hypothetical protein